MDLSRGYNLPLSVQSRLRLLDWINDHDGTAFGVIVDLDPLFEGKDGREVASIIRDLQALELEGLLRLPDGLDWACEVTPAGSDFIESLEAERENLSGRRMAARDGLLAWLYEVTLKGNRAPAIADFRNSTYGGYYGREFTENEIEDATRWLLDQGFITGTPTFGGGVARPSISPLGERVAESGQPISGLSATPANVTTINVEGSLMQEDRTAGPIFVVHGRDHTVLHHAVRVLQQGTGREVIVLHEKPNAGRTILEKFEHHAGPTSYAVILLTGDDEGGPPGDPARSRGRQNVVFELGFFFGRLGRQKVAVLLGEDVEKPSDIDGLVYIGLDPGGAWKHLLCRELAAAGIEVNYSKIP